jgi:hypothetical protein
MRLTPRVVALSLFPLSTINILSSSLLEISSGSNEPGGGGEGYGSIPPSPSLSSSLSSSTPVALFVLSEAVTCEASADREEMEAKG